MSVISLNIDRASSFNREDFKTGLIGTSDCNNYIPVYSLYCHDLILFENKEDIKIIEYSFPAYSGSYSTLRQYTQLNNALRNSVRPAKYYYTLAGENYDFNVMPGMMYDDNNKILMCLAINTNYVLNTTKEELQSSPDAQQFILVMSTEFIDNPIYRNIYKRIKALYIDECFSLGIDVVTTTRSNDWLFRNNYEQPKFKSVAKLMKHLKEEVPKSLLID